MFETQEKTNLIERLKAIPLIIQKQGQNIEAETASSLLSEIESLQARVRSFFQLHDDCLKETQAITIAVQGQEDLKIRLGAEVDRQGKPTFESNNDTVKALAAFGGR